MKNINLSESTAWKNNESVLVATVLFISFIGLVIRLIAPLEASFPLNDGGLFYAMIVDLQESHYSLPPFTTYNAADIPFAYPPLAFYITGLLSDFLQITLIDLLRILPALVSALTIPAFYILAREITSSKIQIIFGVLAFALLPRDFNWLIMGGGITRSFGLLFAILTMASAYRLYTGYKTRHLLACILLGALTILTHPEASVHTAITALIFYLWKDRSLKGFLLSIGIAAGILALTAPWWGVVISRYGLDPFLAISSASQQDRINPLVGLLIFFRFMFTDEPLLPILSILGLIGIFAGLARKQSLLPAWILLLHLFDPRGGTLYMMIPLALSIGIAIEYVILPALRSKEDSGSPKNLKQELEQILSGKVTRYFILFLLSYSLLSAYIATQKIKNEISLQPMDLEAFAWVRENTPIESEFLLITNQQPLRDAWSEWFPVLTDRRSQATVFGYEWVNDGNFKNRIAAYRFLQTCSYKDLSCLENWSNEHFLPFEYIYLWDIASSARYPLSAQLKFNSNIKLVFENEKTMIFRKDQ